MRAALLRAAFWAALPAALEAAGEVGATVEPPTRRGGPGWVRVDAGMSRSIALSHDRGMLCASIDDERDTAWGRDPESVATEAAALVRLSLEASRLERARREADKSSRAVAHSLTVATGHTPGGRPLLDWATAYAEPGRLWVDMRYLRFTEEQARGLVDYLRAIGVLDGGASALTPASSVRVCGAFRYIVGGEDLCHCGAMRSAHREAM